MLRNIIQRPIAVTMVIIAIVVMGCLALKFIPVSLMPDIDIPQITVQSSRPSYSAREIEDEIISPLRSRLSQVAGVKEVRSEARMDAGSVQMTFEPGSNIDLLFIEVNEKIDMAMGTMPKDMERPKVIKASAMDIPAFYLDISMATSQQSAEKNGAGHERGLKEADLRFAQLGKFARGVVSKRIEQLPQTAMVDISGTTSTEIECVPDYEKLHALGLSVHDIESAIRNNNITLEALSISDGPYRYNIHFDSQLLTKEDIENIYINHEGRLLQLKDLCNIEERITNRNGLVRHGKENAITMAVIKQDDAQMSDLQTSMGQLVEDLRKEYPEINFEITRDQTSLLTYTINNLKANLYVGALLACIILFVFMREWRLPFLIVITIPLSLILTLLCFYIMNISLNIISLSGLILGVGMIVDNSIIVIDNIVQKWRSDMGLKDAIVKGTGEVFTPMLSSVLTTCSVFIPLIFLSGIAGALFYDQAMGVTIALFASLIVAALVVPVYFHAFYKKNASCPIRHGAKDNSHMYRYYEKSIKWVLRHARLCLIFFIAIIPLTWALFEMIEKERLPHVEQKDALVMIDWNTGISAKENDRRVADLLDSISDRVVTSTSMIGAQEFILSHTKDITASEAVVYINTESEEDLQEAKDKLTELIQRKYHKASVEFNESGNIYNLIFSTDEPELEIHLQDKNGKRPEIAMVRSFIDTLRGHFPDITIMPVLTETDIRYVADMEQMAVYKISYESLYARLKEIVNRNHILEINEGAESVPVIIGATGKEGNRIMQETVRNTEGTEVPLEYIIKETKGEDYKRLQAGVGGKFYSININAKDRDIERILKFTDSHLRTPASELSASYSGGYFSSRKTLGELAIVLAVALSLLYFILAAQFESFIQPFIILTEMVIDVFFVILGLTVLGETLNVMSMIGIIVMSGIIINDSILKVDTINRLRQEGAPLLRAVFTAGHRRLKPIVMTSLTTILAITPFLYKADTGSALQYPLSLTLIIGMTAGTLVSLFFVPLVYYIIYNRKGKR